MPTDIPLSLYIHFPWCVRKCPYCDFNSHEAKGDLPEQLYIDSLLQDLEKDLSTHGTGIDRRSIDSVFMGGGTPSLFSSEAMASLMDALHVRLNLAADCEVTLEANPGTTDYEKFAGYQSAGINRLSIGVQSFSNQHLSILGRIHTANEVTEAYYAAREAGFTNINLDLMHGLPDQNPEGALQDLESAITLGPEHISWYQLTLEPNTVFYKRPPTLPDDDTLWEIYERGLECLSAAGYERYEVSAFAKPNRQAKHNLNYWQFGDYLGIGAGAHGKITLPEAIIRTTKTRMPADYLAGQKSNHRTIDPNDMLLEYLMNTLRMNEGFSISAFSTRTKLPKSALDDFLQAAVAREMVTVADDRVTPTYRGLQFLNELLMLATP
jgi:putative oxygen-independent coproporphyrinogen III oxidase